MRGVAECLKWMLDNPMMELHMVEGKAKRRYNDEETQFEFFNNTMKYWETASCYFSFEDSDWQPYDPNPSVDFITAYEDCKINGTKYESKDNTIMFNYNCSVFIESRTILEDNYRKDTPLFRSVYIDAQWKKVVS